MKWDIDSQIEYDMLISKIVEFRKYFTDEEISYYGMVHDPLWVLEGIEDVLKERNVINNKKIEKFDLPWVE